MKQTKYDNVFIHGQDVYRLINGEYHKISKWIDNVGYYQVVFRINGKRKYVRLHRLIAQTMLPNPCGLPMINHIDGNKLNNDLNNLEWCDNAHNTQQGYDKGLYHSQRRSHKIIVINKATDEKIEFCSIRQCADQLNLNRKTITSILKGVKTTNNYPYDFEYAESVSTIPDECKGVDLEMSTKSKRRAV